ncbi:MAG: S46 family peptidase [Ignavibacteria bacterium]
MYKKISNFTLLLILFGFIFSNVGFSQYGDNKNTSTRASKYDLGKMWTFDYPPIDYFSQTYNFKPTKEWLDHVRMSALRFATYCSASFVSADGLVMTNHHCGRDAVSEVEKEGEDLHRDGFIAFKLEDERRVENLFVEQLINIMDVTGDIRSAMSAGATEEEKISLRDKRIKELEEQYTDKQNKVRAQVVTLFNGGLYSLYIYKRYDDVRLVFAPEDQAGFFGGDYDNFTYPRYNLDCTFFRVYDNGKPLKTEHYFKWSPKGADVDEPIFVVGNPGRTSRLLTVAQLEFNRDFSYPDRMFYIDFMVDYMTKTIKEHPEKAKELNNRLFSFTNSQKVYKGILKGLNDPKLIERKKDFENQFKEAVLSNLSLKEAYGNVWDKIEEINKELEKIYPEVTSYSLMGTAVSKYMVLADKVISYARKGEAVPDTAISNFYGKINPEYDAKLLEYQILSMTKKIGADNENLRILTNSYAGEDAVKYAIENSAVKSLETSLELSKKTPEEILNLNDPIIKFVNVTRDRYNELFQQFSSLRKKESYNRDLLGQALYEVYGTSIPPDATFTLRISDGVIKSYPYNGTIAPPKTTFYGMYDRYYSFNKEYPFNLPQRWVNPPKEFNLSAPFNFISTNDIIGGNSGSPVINTKGEIIGLAFDGNIESLVDEFIYLDDVPHTVSVDSEGMIEALKNMYKVERLVKELRAGRIE